MEITIKNSNILKLKDYDQHDTVVELNVIDMFQPPRYTGYQYLFRLDDSKRMVTSDELKESLLETLKVFPDFTGSLIYTIDSCFLKYTNKGVKFETAVASFQHHDAIDKIDLNILDVTSKLFFDDKMTVLDSEEDFLLWVTVIELIDKSIMLSVRYHHALCDVHGGCWFMHAWASLTRYGNIGKYTNDTDRSLLRGDGRKSIYAHRAINLTPDSKFAEIVKIAVMKKELVIKRNTLNLLKENLFANIANQKVEYLTSTCVMIAIFLRAVVRVKQLKVVEETGFGMDIECRDMLGLTQSYFGNCVFPLGIFLTVEKIMKIPLADVVGKIRDMTKSVDKEYFNSILNKMEITGKNRHVSSGIDTIRNDFSLSSWSKFPLQNVDFGWGKPTSFKKLFDDYSRFHVWQSVDKKEFVVHVTLKVDQLKSFLADEEVQLLL